MRKDYIPYSWIRQRISSCLHGDDTTKAIAHRELAERLWPALLEIAASHQRRNNVLSGYSLHIAEDAAMHAYIKFLETMEDYLQRSDVMRRLHNAIYHFMLKETRRRSTECLTAVLPDLSLARRTIPQPLSRNYVVLAGVGELTPNQRALVRLRYWEGYTFAELAARWQRSAQWTREMEQIALAALRRNIDREAAAIDGAAGAAM